MHLTSAAQGATKLVVPAQRCGQTLSESMTSPLRLSGVTRIAAGELEADEDGRPGRQ